MVVGTSAPTFPMRESSTASPYRSKLIRVTSPNIVKGTPSKLLLDSWTRLNGYE